MTANAAEIRECLNEGLDARRERLRRIEDATLVALVEHLRGLIPNPEFDPVVYLNGWLWGPVPVFGGLTPAEVLERADGLDRVIESWGRQVAGVYV